MHSQAFGVTCIRKPQIINSCTPNAVHAHHSASQLQFMFLKICVVVIPVCIMEQI